MNIRTSNNKDLDAIRQVHENAFGEPKGEVISQLACDILADDTAMPLISLVAEENNKIIGHVIFSSAAIEGNEALSVFILAPLAVLKSHQRKGIGSALIKHGLAELKHQGADIVMVLGHPNYYTRSGFSPDHSIEPLYKLTYPEAWMVFAFNHDILKQTKGRIQCATSLSAPEHW